MRFLLDDGIVLDEERRELRRGGALVAVEPQVFDLLAHLLNGRGRVVTRDDLLASVWRGRIVSESTLASRVNAARRAIGDSGEAQRLIRTIPRRGFRFVGAVQEQGGAASAPDTAARPRQEVTFCCSADGAALAVAAAGEGPLLLRAGTWLTHVEKDWDSPLWSPLLRRLAQRHRLIRYDARGNGLSDRDVAAITFDAFVEDLAAVAASLGNNPFALMGASQGGAAAIAYAAAHPGRVSRLILCGAYARGRNRRSTPVEREKAQALMTLMRQGWGDERSAFMQAFSSVYLPKGTPEQIRWWTDLQRATTSAETAIRFRDACDEIDVSDLLPRVRAPTLVLHSRGDTVSPFEEGRRIAAAIPQARFVELDSDNHVIMEGEPAWLRLLDEIERFLASADHTDTAAPP
jgi:pimeloyl-ACP methyl ester carboxylesterase/DNA-binding winged helix-turn-helix (wHTH) protein